VTDRDANAAAVSQACIGSSARCTNRVGGGPSGPRRGAIASNPVAIVHVVHVAAHFVHLMLAG